MTSWTELRTATRDRLVAVGIAGGNVEASRYAPIPSDGTTHARVYLRAGSYRADGHPGTGEPSFNRDRRLIISVTRAGPAGGELDDDLDGDIDAVLSALLTDADWVGLGDGVGSIEVDYDARDDGQFRSIEAVISIEVSDWVSYPPVVSDTFDTAAVTTDLGSGEPAAGAHIEPPQA